MKIINWLKVSKMIVSRHYTQKTNDTHTAELKAGFELLDTAVWWLDLQKSSYTAGFVAYQNWVWSHEMGLETDSEALTHGTLAYKQQPLEGATYKIPRHKTFDKAGTCFYHQIDTFSKLLHIAIFTFYTKKVKIQWQGHPIGNWMAILTEESKTKTLRWTDYNRKGFLLISPQINQYCA